MNQEHKKNTHPQRIALYGILIAVAACLAIIDSMIPLSAAIPGLKLGLANTVTMAILIYIDVKPAIIVLLARCILSALTFGTLPGLLFSLAGGLLSLLVMALMKYKHEKWFSIYGISIAGAAAHHVGQIAVAWLLTGTAHVFSYLPLLLLCSVFTGALTAFICKILFERLIHAGALTPLIK